MGWRILSWLLLILLFVVALGLSLANTEMTGLRFFLLGDQPLLRAPLVALLLAFFATGFVAGMLARLPAYWRQRRRIKSLERRIRQVQDAQIPEVAFPATSTRRAPATDGPVPRLGR
ncbi:MAG: LapA family protein [Burkholderiaceae bacterium]